MSQKFSISDENILTKRRLHDKNCRGRPIKGGG